MKKNNSIYLFLIILFIINPLTCQIYSQITNGNQTVAVLNFANNTNSSGLEYLSRAFSESISTTISQKKESNLTIVEREQLNKVINELALNETGLVENVDDVINIGKLAKTDILIIGSYSGNPESITLSIKAIEINSGKILDGKNVTGPLSDIFDLANRAILSVIAVISGDSIGFLSISSEPSNCMIYINSILIGKSPIIEYKIPVGEHNIKTVSDGFISDDKTIHFKKDSRINYNPILVKKSFLSQSKISFSIDKIFHNKNNLIDDDFIYSFSFGHPFNYFNIIAEIGYSEIKHNEELESAFGTIEIKRKYQLYKLSTHLIYEFSRFSNYIKPYSGVSLSLNTYSDKKESGDDWKEIQNESYFSLGLITGIEFVPLSKISVFIESRYYHFFKKGKRFKHYIEGFNGGILKDSEEINLNHFYLGIGLKYFL